MLCDLGWIDHFNLEECIAHTQTEAKEGEGEIVDVTVVARTVEKQDYYENGSHF